MLATSPSFIASAPRSLLRKAFNKARVKDDLRPEIASKLSKHLGLDMHGSPNGPSASGRVAGQYFVADHDPSLASSRETLISIHGLERRTEGHQGYHLQPPQ